MSRIGNGCTFSETSEGCFLKLLISQQRLLFISKYAQMAATRHILHCYSDNNASVLDPSNFLAASCNSLL